MTSASTFSIDHDRATLLPFIRAAKAVNPSLRIWASPWCPPSWMKVNKHYANTSASVIFRSWAGMQDRMEDNLLPEDRQIPEGVDAFIQDPAYLEAYARYFGKFIDAYKAEGVDVFMVMPQNEPNSAQWYPACTWTPEGLAAFIKYLGPEMASRGVDVYLGTMERADPDLWDRILTDPEAGPCIKGMGFQWAGKDALPELHRRHPSLPCYQTEQECGDGRNDWAGAMHSWDLMKHYIGNGVQSYFYWRREHVGMDPELPRGRGQGEQDLPLFPGILRLQAPHALRPARRPRPHPGRHLLRRPGLPEPRRPHGPAIGESE